MGRNILAFTDAEYDLAHGIIRLVFPSDDCKKANMAYWAGPSPVTELDLMEDWHSKVPAIRAKVKLNGSPITALFDTGATSVVSKAAAHRAGVEETAMESGGLLYGAGSGSARSWKASFERFDIGGETIHNNRLRVGDFDLDDADMLLGIDFFLSHRIYVSKQQSKIFMTYNGGVVFALDRGLADDDGPAPLAEAETDTPKTADQLARRGAASAARGNLASALADLDRACALEPASATLFAQRGTLRAALMQPTEALEDYDRALALDPVDTDARFQRAALRALVDDNEGAKADLDALDRTLAPQADLRLSLARVYMAIGQPTPAIAQSTQWLAKHATDVNRSQGLNNRCWNRMLAGVELKEALADCDEAVGSDRKNAAYLDSRGWVYLRLGQNEKALGDFERGLEIQATSASSLYGRGIARTRTGDAARGEADLAAARKAEPDIDVRMAGTGLVQRTASKDP